MENSQKKKKTRQLPSKVKSQEKILSGKENPGSAYDEYLWLLQQRNKLLKKLKTKDEQQVELEKREQGFSLYINGANRETGSLLTSRRTKTADGRYLHNEVSDDEHDESRAKTAPTKLTRKEWKPATFVKIKTDEGSKVDVKASGKITGIYSEDFDGTDENNESSEDENGEPKVDHLSLSFNDVHKLRKSLEMDNSIRQSIQAAVEAASVIDSDISSESSDDEINERIVDIKDVDESEDEEIEEELEMGNSSLNVHDSTAIDNLPCLKSSYVISKEKQQQRCQEVVMNKEEEMEDDTIVLTFSKPCGESLKKTRPLSATCRKKVESSLVLRSQDVLEAVASENKHIDTTKPPSSSCDSGNKEVPHICNMVTDDTIALVTKKVRKMDASQQQQLLELLGKLDTVPSEDVVIVPSKRHKQTALSPTKVQTTEFSSFLDETLEVTFEITSNWGHSQYVGLTEIQFFDDCGSITSIPRGNIEIVNGSEKYLTNLVNGKTKTTNEKNMWKSSFKPNSPLELLFHVPCLWQNGEHNLSKIKIWNYNKRMKDLHIGVKNMRIFIGGELLWTGVVEKGCGNQIYDYAETIDLKLKEEDTDNKCSINNPVIRSETVTLSESDEETAEKNLQATFDFNHLKGPSPTIPLYVPVESIASPTLSNPELASKPTWLDDIKERRSHSVQLPVSHNPPLSPQWLNTNNDDDHSVNKLFEQTKSKSRPTSGRRSSQAESTKTTPRPESVRRDKQQQQQFNQDLHEQLSKLCVSDLACDEQASDQEKLLEESFNSLSQFMRSHQGRLDKEQQGDALDELLTQVQPTNDNSEQSISEVDNFVIPELPSGQQLVINILSTWGDQYYVGLNGIEVFSDTGKPVQITKIDADPSDINVLPEYSKDPRVVANLIDGVYCTRDDMHLWLAPFTTGKHHLIYIEFKSVFTIAMIRIWNYNKSRIHSFRGAKDVEIFLDKKLIFRGEMARASGELGSSETFGDTILFTMNEAIFEAMAANDQTYEPDFDEDEDYLQASNYFKRPTTSDTGNEQEALERPFTSPKVRLKPTVEATYPNQIQLENIKHHDFTRITENQSPTIFIGKVLQLNFVDTWGDLYYLGLTGLQLLGVHGEIIELTHDMLQASPNDLNDLPEYEDDARTLENIIDGDNVTTSDEHMWLIPFTSGADHLLTITLKQPTQVTGLRIWNYNKSPESTYRGAKIMEVKLDGKIISQEDGILIRKGPGNCHFDFGQEILFKDNYTRKVSKARSLKRLDNDEDDYELTIHPQGFIFQLQLLDSWGDPYYLGLNGIEFYDEDGQIINLDNKNITAYPDSVNILEGVKGDIRTPDKLIDNINDTDDGRHMWLAPIFQGLTNLIYVVFDEPVTISMVKIWNYRKTPIRGVKQLSILVDDLLVFSGILPQVPTITRGILPNMTLPVPHATILFTDDEAIKSAERPYIINAGGFFEEEVALVNDKSDQRLEYMEIDQALRPMTSVTQFSRPRK